MTKTDFSVIKNGTSGRTFAVDIPCSGKQRAFFDIEYLFIVHLFRMRAGPSRPIAVFLPSAADNSRSKRRHDSAKQ
jgi:hypothetical protein